MPMRKAAPVDSQSPHTSAVAAAELLSHGTSASSSHGNGYGSTGIYGVLDRAASLAAMRLAAEALQSRRDELHRRLTQVILEQPCDRPTQAQLL